MAHASSSVIVSCEPRPWRTPPVLLDPDRTMSRFEPRLWICSAMRACAPEPIETIAITAATPMMMPSIVRMLRSLLTRSARTAMRALASAFMPRRPPGQAERTQRGGWVRARSCRVVLLFLEGQGREHSPGLPWCGHDVVPEHPAVPEGDHARGELGDVRFVRHEHHCDALTVQVLQDRHHLDARARVQIAGGLVGQDE